MNKACFVVTLASLCMPLLACAESDENDADSIGATDESSSGEAEDEESSGGEEDDGEGSGDTSDGGETGEEEVDGGETGEEEGGGEGVCEQQDPGIGSTVALGAPVAHMEFLDGEGSLFNLCQLGGEKLLLDSSTVWCGPCNAWSALLADMEPSGGPDDDALLAALDTKVFTWVTILFKDNDSNPAVAADAAAWDAKYPTDRAITVVPTQGQHVAYHDYMLIDGAWPTFYAIDEDFTWYDLQPWNAYAWSE